jgi:hypothetical protein
LNNSLNSLSNKILQGRPGSNVAPSEKFVLDEIDKFKSLINNNRINMSSLVAQKRSFNEELQNNLFKLTDKASRTRAKTLAKQISHDVRDTMQEYGKANPEWWKYQSSADEAFGAIEQSNYISRILQKYLHGKSSALTHLFGVGIPSASAHLTGPFATSIGVTAYIASKLGHRVLRSKALKTHYAKVIAAAATDNPKIIHKKIDELEQAIKEDEKKKPGKYKKVG